MHASLSRISHLPVPLKSCPMGLALSRKKPNCSWSEWQIQQTWQSVGLGCDFFPRKGEVPTFSPLNFSSAEPLPQAGVRNLHRIGAGEGCALPVSYGRLVGGGEASEIQEEAAGCPISKEEVMRKTGFFTVSNLFHKLVRLFIVCKNILLHEIGCIRHGSSRGVVTAFPCDVMLSQIKFLKFRKLPSCTLSFPFSLSYHCSLCCINIADITKASRTW